MKHLLSASAVMVAVIAVPAIAGDVGVSVQVGEPGFYGRIDIGNFPQPQVIYPRPVVIQHVSVGLIGPPIYLRVPPGHAKKWAKHCHKYNACGQPVYFVQARWYNDVYVPRYREGHGWDHGERRGDDRGHDHGHGHGYGRPQGRLNDETYSRHIRRRRSWRSDPQLVTATRARVAEWPPIASADLTAHARLQLILNLVSPLAHQRL